MIYITVDGMLSGTGIRDTLNGGYLDPEELGLSNLLKSTIIDWLEKYENCHYMQYKDLSEIELLDKEGIKISKMIKLEIPNSKIEYYSNAKMKKISLVF